MSSCWSLVSVLACHLGGAVGVALYRSLVWLRAPAAGQPSTRGAVTVTDNSAKKVFVHTVSINKDKIIEVKQCSRNIFFLFYSVNFFSDQEISRAGGCVNNKAGNHFVR